MEFVHFSISISSKVPDFWLYERSPSLVRLYISVPGLWGVWWLGFFVVVVVFFVWFYLFIFVCLFCLGALFLIAIACFSVFLLYSDFFLPSHALTVSFGICQHLLSGENGLQVAVCVKN